MANDNPVSKRKSRWTGKTQAEKNAHMKVMSLAYWNVSDEVKKARAAKARSGKAAKSAKNPQS